MYSTSMLPNPTTLNPKFLKKRPGCLNMIPRAHAEGSGQPQNACRGKEAFAHNRPKALSHKP